MSGESGKPTLSAIDEERFGIRTARVGEVTSQGLPGILEYCHDHGVRLLIARCPARDLAAVQAMERAGFELMDTLLYFARDLIRIPIPEDSGTTPIRPIRPGEEAVVRTVAEDSFRNYSGHYHADSRLDRSRSDAAYVSWAVRSCTDREVAGEVLVADRDGEILGFATLRLNTPEQGEGVLFGVASRSQGRGIYRSFMIGGMRWCVAQGAARMVVSTQITNLAVQKVWVRVGFEPDGAQYTFHKWFDADGQPA